MSDLAVGIVAAAGGLVAAGAMTAVSRRLGIVDVPNHRSSHQHPVPRGVGAAIVAVAVLVGLVAATPPAALTAALLAGVLVAAVGMLDDVRGLGAGARLAVHAGAATWAAAWLVPTLELPGPAAVAVGVGTVLAITWSINLHNFMDGIDGIAAGTALVVAACLAVAASGPPATLAAALAGACAGFLPWNWPRAKVFMGDVGSGFLGFALVVLAVAAAADEPTALLVVLAADACFLVDATATLLVRAARRERLTDAHSGHAYQRLARHAGRHLPATAAYLAVAAVGGGVTAAVAPDEPATALAATVVLLVVASLWMLVVRTLPASGSRRPTPGT